eukprot:m.88484 g.88484  ORF g.88484 m.88484 type:complete len:375 (-) comp14943_c1_seq1:56-1180(-)
MFTVDNPGETREQARIEARRRADAERRERLFNPKNGGKDLDALQAQIEEKRQREQQEREQLLLEAEEMNRQDKLLQLLEQRKQEDLRALRLQEAEYRKTHQQKHQRREYDLNDPMATRGGAPIRQGDDDPHLGPSSIQKFAGEDPDYDLRMKQQVEQQQAWARKQMDIQHQRRSEEAAIEHLQDLQMRERTQRELELQRAMDDARRDALAETREFNKCLAEEKRRQEQQARAQEEEDNRADQMAALNSDMLTQNPSTAYTESGRLITDRFRGFTPQQHAEIRQTQLAQVSEAEARKAEERALREAEERETMAAARHALLAERQAARARKEALRRASEENARMAEQHKLRQKQEREQARTTFAPEFFDQFQRSAR